MSSPSLTRNVEESIQWSTTRSDFYSLGKKEKYNFMKQQRILIEFELTCSEFAIESILFNLKDSKHTGDTHTSITL